MYLYRLTTAANRDVVEILAYTEANFGQALRRHYQAAIAQSLMDICADPNRRGVVELNELAGGLLTYHFRHNARTKLQIRNPRHLLVFRFAGPGLLLVVRVLHENMDIARHIGNDN